MDSLGHQHCAKKLSPKIALHFKVLFKSKATLPLNQTLWLEPTLEMLLIAQLVWRSPLLCYWDVNMEEVKRKNENKLFDTKKRNTMVLKGDKVLFISCLIQCLVSSVTTTIGTQYLVR